MGLWGRGQQHRQWRAEFKDVSTPELRSKVEAGLDDPDKQRVVQGLLISIIVGGIAIIGAAIGIIIKAFQ